MYFRRGRALSVYGNGAGGDFRLVRTLLARCYRQAYVAR